MGLSEQSRALSIHAAVPRPQWSSPRVGEAQAKQCLRCPGKHDLRGGQGLCPLCQGVEEMGKGCCHQWGWQEQQARATALGWVLESRNCPRGVSHRCWGVQEPGDVDVQGGPTSPPPQR